MKAAKSSLITFSIVCAIVVFQISLARLPAGSIALGAAMASYPASRPATQAAISVKIENFAFEPKEVDIPVGTTVTWQNADDVPHTATSADDPQAFDSGPLDTDDKFSFTFTKPGIYAYYCKVHPHMKGVITVK
jgi:plastocyanin